MEELEDEDSGIKTFQNVNVRLFLRRRRYDRYFKDAHVQGNTCGSLRLRLHKLHVVLVCRPSGLSPFWLCEVLRTLFSPFWRVAVLTVAVSTCPHFGLSSFWLVVIFTVLTCI